VLNTGLRKAEVLGLKWDRVCFINNQFEITRTRNQFGLNETTKTHNGRFVPINPNVRLVLEQLQKEQRHPEYVFTYRDGTLPEYSHFVQREYVQAQIKANMSKKIHFHGLRHTYASNFMMNGGDIYALKEILGHKSIDTTNRYAHLDRKYLQEASRTVMFSGDFESNNPDLTHIFKNEKKVLRLQ